MSSFELLHLRSARAFTARNRGRALVALLGAVCFSITSPLPSAEKSEQDKPAETVAQTPSGADVSGAELFNREWIPNDPRSHGGDGLGPVFNDTSCVACHNQGGPGGGGPASKNVDIVSAFPITASPNPPRRSAMQSVIRGLLGLEEPVRRGPSREARERKRQRLIKEVERIHPGFVTSQSVVVHLFGTDDKYAAWRQRILANEHGMDLFSGSGMHAHEANFDVVASELGDATPESVNLAAHGLEIESIATVEVELGELQKVGVGETVEVELATDASGVEAAVEGPTPAFAETVPADAQQATVESVTTVAADEVHEHHSHSEHVHLREFTQASQEIQTLRAASGFFSSNSHFIGNFALTTTHRNPTALFGVGVMDQISDAAIQQAAAQKHPDFPGISGRVCRLPDGRIGRFGWKAQKATLRDFAMTACAVELGLNVPEHPQSGHPSKPEYRPAGFDMDKAECDSLVNYLQDLPRPQQLNMDGPQKEYIEHGRQLFVKVGCAACHQEQIGQVTGLYSDMLLHDMGEELGDTGSYGVFVPDSKGGEAEGAVPRLADADIDVNPAAPVDESKILGATRLEWRTPPLWGLRDSAPYMHDGRAENIEQAIAFHGGEANRVTHLYFSLKREERQQVQAFLRSLAAPTMTVRPQPADRTTASR